MLVEITGCEIKLYDNPRREKADNDLNVTATLSKIGGFEPILLRTNMGLISEVTDIVKANISNYDPDVVTSKASWHV
jgi:hypothetical protein